MNFVIKSIIMISVVSILLATPCLAEETKELPERLISMALEYTGVEIAQGENVSMDVIFYNKGKSDENVRVWVSEKPEKWTTRLKTYQFAVSGMHVPSDDSKTLTFEAEPGDEVSEGDYSFKIEAQTPDSKFKMAQNLSIRVTGKDEGNKKSKGIKITTSYPVLKGPSDGEFEFSLEVESELEEDAIFDLLADGPEGWDINFKPAYETKYISSLRIKSNQKQTVAVQVKPPVMATKGEYPLKIRVRAEGSSAEADLLVELTGTYQLEAGTPNGLLSLDARQGNASNISVYIKNTGSAANRNISFMSFKPENWKVEFDPEKIDVINPGELKQVDVSIIPYENALVGDYSVGLQIGGEKDQKDLELRVSVKASSAWAWVGIVIIVITILLLTLMFRKLGRR